MRWSVPGGEQSAMIEKSNSHSEVEMARRLLRCFCESGSGCSPVVTQKAAVPCAPCFSVDNMANVRLVSVRPVLHVSVKMPVVG